jgi:hypothetical protein
MRKEEEIKYKLCNVDIRTSSSWMRRLFMLFWRVVQARQGSRKGGKKK